MKAVVQLKYGSPDDVLQLLDVETPVVADGEVLLRVRAASMHVDVWHVVTGWPYALRLAGDGLRRPKTQIPGTDVAGQVESTGKRFQLGGEVFGEAVVQFMAARQCVRGVHGRSTGWAGAEPDNVTFEQAATVPTSGSIALRNLRGAGRSPASGEHRRRLLRRGGGA